MFLGSLNPKAQSLSIGQIRVLKLNPRFWGPYYVVPYVFGDAESEYVGHFNRSVQSFNITPKNQEKVIEFGVAQTQQTDNLSIYMWYESKLLVQRLNGKF